MKLPQGFQRRQGHYECAGSGLCEKCCGGCLVGLLSMLFFVCRCCHQPALSSPLLGAPEGQEILKPGQEILKQALRNLNRGQGLGLPPGLESMLLPLWYQ